MLLMQLFSNPIFSVNPKLVRALFAGYVPVALLGFIVNSVWLTGIHRQEKIAGILITLQHLAVLLVAVSIMAWYLAQLQNTLVKARSQAVFGASFGLVFGLFTVSQYFYYQLPLLALVSGIITPVLSFAIAALVYMKMLSL